MPIGSIIALVLLILVIFTLIRCICIVPQASAWVIESLGRYKETWGAGLHFKVPIIYRVIKRSLSRNRSLTLNLSRSSQRTMSP